MHTKPRCFIDSNIWLYAFVEGDDLDKHKKAQPSRNKGYLAQYQGPTNVFL